jgi:hypothetical protein
MQILSAPHPIAHLEAGSTAHSIGIGVPRIDLQNLCQVCPDSGKIALVTPGKSAGKVGFNTLGIDLQGLREVRDTPTEVALLQAGDATAEVVIRSFRNLRHIRRRCRTSPRGQEY